MMPIPDSLQDRPFSVQEAHELGLGEGRLRSRRLHRPTYGVRWVEEADSIVDQARSLLPALPPGWAFSHVTACQLWDVPVPSLLADSGALDVIRPTNLPQFRRHGVRGHRGLEWREVSEVQGLAVVGLADTWVDLGELGHRLSADDLIAAGDAIATRLVGIHPVGENREPETDRAAAATVLTEHLLRRVRPRGKLRLGQVLPLIRPGVRSAMESRARMMFVWAGFPTPEVNGRVEVDGEFLLEGDLVWRRERIIGEYQGGDHASRTQRSRDASRVTTAADAGWTILEIFAEDVFHGARRRACLYRFADHLGIPRGGLLL